MHRPVRATLLAALCAAALATACGGGSSAGGAADAGSPDGAGRDARPGPDDALPDGGAAPADAVRADTQGGAADAAPDAGGGDAPAADLPDAAGPPDAAGAADAGTPCARAADCAAARGAPPACRAWSCVDGACATRPADDGSACDDGDACTAGDRCAGGACGGAPVLCADDGSPCTLAVCDPASGCTTVPVTGLECDDADACTEGDTCLLSKCMGQPLRCDDGDPCTLDSCDPASGCDHAPAAGAPCDDGAACTTADACGAAGCAGVPTLCDDGDPCTRDECDPATGACAHRAAYGPPCDDGSLCTVGDYCADGACTGRAVDCADGNPCTTDECDPATGCVNGPADGAPCHDGNACTDEDRCVAGACLGQATACDDGNPCTQDDCTIAGGCVHREPTGLPCDDGDACTAADRCVRGVCEPGAPVLCDDGDACTADSCDPATGCTWLALDGPPCDDGDACTADDACAAGACVGAAVTCDDSEACTADSCDPTVGCVFAPLADPCDDGDPCTAGDVCAEGRCQPGWDPECLAVERVVLAGDSWSAGLIYPLRDALDARGYEEVTVTWELTAKPGSTVAGWLSDASLMAGLFVSLDAQPPAEVLFFTLGGNDYLGACRNGLGLLDPLGYYLVMLRIQADLQTFVALARQGRPHLKVVLIGYDYLNYFVMQALGIDFPGMDWLRFNLGLVELAARGRAAVGASADMVYAHNMGLLQHTFGDPLFGYGPGAAPKPGPAPGYDPFPGGWYTYPSPAAHIPDGIHPDYDGFRALIENALDQGPAAWIEGGP